MDPLLSLLSHTGYISGERLCESLGITRAAVWKRVEKLREEGYDINSAGKRGYRLVPRPDSLLPGYLAMDLSTQWAGRGDIFYKPDMTSTNTVLKAMAYQGAARGSLAVCELQTEGKGRLGRRWEAALGENLLHSLLLCPAMPTEKAQLCTLAAATAMAGAVEETVLGLSVGIKWPNDLLIGGKKCAGILSEISADMDGIRFVVMGVGVNVNQRHFGGELEDKATSLWLEQGKLAGSGDMPGQDARELPPIDRRALLCAYLSRMEKAVEAIENQGLQGILPEYLRRSVTLGARVRVTGIQGEFLGRAEALDETGALWVTDEQGERRRVLSGDVSVRGERAYA
ncbi:MAG: biotin--[acetyl-CoA-carboxylase] ligase [Clostridiales bacterium]|nr:biotin--[acetyl-CoA-carboxylase] ligase [Clostridiales bacterium]